MKKILLFLITFLFCTNAYCDGMGYLAVKYVFYFLLYFFILLNTTLFIAFLYKRSFKIKIITIISCIFFLVFLYSWISTDNREGFSLAYMYNHFKLNNWRFDLLLKPLMFVITLGATTYHFDNEDIKINVPLISQQ